MPPPLVPPPLLKVCREREEERALRATLRGRGKVEKEGGEDFIFDTSMSDLYP